MKTLAINYMKAQRAWGSGTLILYLLCHSHIGIRILPTLEMSSCMRMVHCLCVPLVVALTSSGSVKCED